MLSYLIDKKEYRKRKIFEERIASSKSICILGTYLVDIKLITSHFLPIFTLINIRTRVPFKIISTPNNQSITKLPNLQKRVFPQKDKKTSPTRQYTHPQYTYNSYFSYRERSTGSFLLYYYIMYIRIRFSQAS